MLTEPTISWRQALGVRIAVGAFSALAVLAIPYSSALGAESRAILHVDYTVPTISVEAHDVPVQDVLVAVGDQVGFTVQSLGPITSQVIHMSLHEVSIQEVLDALLGGRNYAMSYRPGSAPSDEAIEKVFVLGAPDSEGIVTSRVGTIGGDYPSRATGIVSPAQDFQARLSELHDRNKADETNQKDPSDVDPNLVRQHQQTLEKARSIFDTLSQATQMESMNGKATPPASLVRAHRELEQEIEPFRDVLMEMTSERQK